MSDNLIVFQRVDEVTFTASAGTDGSFPLTNLADGRYYTQWMANANTINQTLQAVFPAARRVTSALIANHNFAALGADSIELEYYNGSSWVSLITINPASDPIYCDGFDQTVTTYRIKFNKASGSLSEKPKIGMLFLGRPATLPIHSNNPRRGLKAALVRDESISGLPYVVSTTAARQTWGIDFGALRTEANSEIYRWLNDVVLGLHPYWMRDIDGNWHFVRNDFDGIEGTAKGNAFFDWRGLQISEERTGVTIQLPGGYTV